ncbi:MAG: hypothetical protein KZQ76_01170 [Candidatus Thiodiazotropha sp. (ex Epidulcina cf. delphinae)]|nr:hypothetical protein [Candidatus Thiodiazotropha sp. (ex Epidulcina cf. delphinae)]
MIVVVTIAALAFIQNVAFTLTSRSRNRNNLTYHMVTAVFSNGIFFLTFRELILAEMSWVLFLPYIIGTVTGSLFGAQVAFRIERIIGARADADD